MRSRQRHISRNKGASTIYLKYYFMRQCVVIKWKITRKCLNSLWWYTDPLTVDRSDPTKGYLSLGLTTFPSTILVSTGIAWIPSNFGFRNVWNPSTEKVDCVVPKNEWKDTEVFPTISLINTDWPGESNLSFYELWRKESRRYNFNDPSTTWYFQKKMIC